MPSAKPKWSWNPVERRGALLVDDLDRARGADPAQRLARLLEPLLVDAVERHQHVRLAGAEAGLPVRGCARAAVAESLGARRHALAELVREACRAASSGSSSAARPSYVNAACRAVGGGPLCPRLGGAHLRQHPSHEGAHPLGVDDPQEQVRDRRIRVAAQDVALEVGEIDLGFTGRIMRRRRGTGAGARPARARRASIAKSTIRSRSARLSSTPGTVASGWAEANRLLSSWCSRTQAHERLAGAAGVARRSTATTCPRTSAAPRGTARARRRTCS